MCEILGILEGYDMGALGFHRRRACISWWRRCVMPTWTATPCLAIRPSWRTRSSACPQGPRGANPGDDPALTAPRRRATCSRTCRRVRIAETTHYSILVEEGNAVSMIYTVNGFFGAGVMAPGTGFLHERRNGRFHRQAGRAEPVRPGAGRGQRDRPRQAAAVLDGAEPRLQDGQVLHVIGCPGGSRIITITLETALNIVDYGMQPQEAVDAHAHPSPVAARRRLRRAASPSRPIRRSSSCNDLGYKIMRTDALGRGRIGRGRRGVPHAG